MQIALSIWKTDNPICIRDIEKLRTIAGRIKSDTEWIIQSRIGKQFSSQRAAFGAKNFNLIGMAFGDKNVAIRSAEQKTRITKPTRNLLELKSRRHAQLRCLRTCDDSGTVINR